MVKAKANSSQLNELIEIIQTKRDILRKDNQTGLSEKIDKALIKIRD